MTSDGPRVRSRSEGPGGVVLGCVADDLTGATDLGSVLATEGLSTLVTVGVPDREVPPADAVVVALKSRTAPVDEAVRDARAALEWLQGHGARQVVFKYCSTFDSTDEGNIGPVADALVEGLDAGTTVVCPALPENARTVYQGHLFVGHRLLSESPMADHPLTPMRDADLVRHLGRQTAASVDRIDYATVSAGAEAVRDAIDACREAGVRYAVVDALDDTHLRTIGAACADLPLVTGGSGVARGLPGNLRRRGLVGGAASAHDVVIPDGPAVILAGSSSEATREQVRRHAGRGPVLVLDPLALDRDAGALDDLSRHAGDALGDAPVLVAASAPPSRVRDVQATLGVDRAARLIEDGLGRLAVDLVRRGARRVVVAGGETSGAVVRALGVAALEIGPTIAPGVPWTRARRDPVADGPGTPSGGDGEVLGLALKSGNFGGPDFFREALAG